MSLDPRGNLDLLLLATLAKGPAHGYRLIERIREDTAASFDLQEGTVYPALHKLERDGLLASRWSDGEGRRRRVYRLTRRGRSALERERAEWDGLVRAVAQVVAQ